MSKKKLTQAQAIAMLGDLEYVGTMGENRLLRMTQEWGRHEVIAAINRSKGKIQLSGEKEASQGYGLCITDYAGRGFPIWLETSRAKSKRKNQ